MADVHTTEQRRRNMQAVRARNTQQEMLLRRALRAAGLMGYRVNLGSVFGRPDIAYTRWKVAVFVDGCFWHMCPECFRSPSTNTEFWMDKLAGNVRRDTLVTKELQGQGWSVLRFWEHEVRADAQGCAQRVAEVLGEAGRDG